MCLLADVVTVIIYTWFHQLREIVALQPHMIKNQIWYQIDRLFDVAVTLKSLEVDESRCNFTCAELPWNTKVRSDFPSWETCPSRRIQLSSMIGSTFDKWHTFGWHWCFKTNFCQFHQNFQTALWPSRIMRSSWETKLYLGVRWLDGELHQREFYLYPCNFTRWADDEPSEAQERSKIGTRAKQEWKKNDTEERKTKFRILESSQVQL